MPEEAEPSPGIRLDAFLLAEAIALHDNLAYIHGGGFTRLDVPTLPFAQPQISVFARFVGEPEDLAGAHTAGISLSDPAGADLIPRTALPFAVQKERDLLAGEERTLTLGVTLGPIPLQHEGLYALELWFDDRLVRNLSFPVRVIDLSEPPPGWTKVSHEEEEGG